MGQGAFQKGIANHGGRTVANSGTFQKQILASLIRRKPNFPNCMPMWIIKMIKSKSLSEFIPQSDRL